MKDKKLIAYIVVVIALFVVMIAVELNRKEAVDWSPTFINTGKNPYGTFILFDLLNIVFPDSQVNVSRFPAANELSYVPDDDYLAGEYVSGIRRTGRPEGITTNSPGSYIFINSSFGAGQYYSFQGDNAGSFDVTKLDIDALLNFAGEGNNVFIAAERMTSLLLDSLDITIKTEWASSDTVFVFCNTNINKEYSMQSINGPLHYFHPKDTVNTGYSTIIESKTGKKPVFIQVKSGQGYFYLSTFPSAFSNINLLDTEKYDYAFRCLSYLPKNGNIIWDEYLKQGRIGETSVFRVVWNHPAMLWAYYILIASGLLFMIFRSKRMQRIIPVVEPPKNTSLEFLDTISNLYYQKHAYKSIVEKRHNYFLDVIRSRYYMNTETTDNEFYDTLSKKSGVEKFILKDIFSYYNEIIRSEDVSNNDLLGYNEKLEEFYHKMK